MGSWKSPGFFVSKRVGTARGLQEVSPIEETASKLTSVTVHYSGLLPGEYLLLVSC